MLPSIVPEYLLYVKSYISFTNLCFTLVLSSHIYQHWLYNTPKVKQGKKNIFVFPRGQSVGCNFFWIEENDADIIL